MAKEFKLDKERCKGCFLCIEFCPNGVLEASKDVNSKGSKYVVFANKENCKYCGLCFAMCPDCGIEIVVCEEKKNEK